MEQSSLLKMLGVECVIREHTRKLFSSILVKILFRIFFKGIIMYIFFSGKTQSQKVMIVNREEVNARCLQVVDFIHFSRV